MGKKIILTEEKFKEIICGVISDDKLLTEYARVGFLGKNGGLEVYVMTDDPGYIPHFHVRDVTTRGGEVDTCIEITTNKYFLHGRHKDMLNSKLCKELAEFMEARCLNSKYENNYELTVDMWNMNNSNTSVEYNGNIPNYREIAE